MILTLARLILHTVRRRRLSMMAGQIGWRQVPAGFWMLIDPNEWFGRTVMMGYYESHLVYCIHQCVHEGDTCLDIGAHQGYSSMHFARAAGTTGCLVAIEPTRIAFERLVQNVQRNGFRTITCVNIAAGDTPTTLEIWCNPQESGHSSIYSRPSETSVCEVISVKPVDTILAETLGEDAHSRLAFVKIDVEGYEPPVLDGMSRTLRLAQPIIWIEVNPPLLAKGGYRASDIERRLEAYNYRFFKPHFRRNAIGIPSLTLEPYRDIDARLAGKMADLVAVVPGSAGWQRILNSKIRLIEGELSPCIIS